jgi:hypothetical protein
MGHLACNTQSKSDFMVVTAAETNRRYSFSKKRGRRLSFMGGLFKCVDLLDPLKG